MKSHTKGAKDKLFKLVGFKTYRCRDCSWRGYILDRNAASAAFSLSLTKLLILAAAILSAAATLFLISFLKW
ncbi:MAG: hypothetical protein PHY31_05395 [Smithellaceae bacterium]|nr:hypothetical protein [Smithellaceae bacterium]